MFYQWLPVGADKGIRLRRNDLELLLWFDVKSAQSAKELSEEEIPYHIDLTAHRIYADITTTVDDIDLLSYMYNRDFSRQPTQEEEPLAERYEDHGREVFSLLRDGVNGLLTFIRTEKGQFWIDTFEIDLDNISSHAVSFKAKAQINDDSWFRWDPTQRSRMSVIVSHESDPRFLVPTDWPKAQAFVTSEKRPELTRQLLAAAEALADAENGRAALTEAVTALEVALNRFAKSPKPEYLLTEPVRSRLGLENLGTLQGRLGLTASVSFLLPILFDPSTLTSKTLSTAREAIQERQNVVHGGQRRVDPDSLWHFLSGIRKLCEVLQDATVT